jgi:hypothetical protein
MKDLLKFLYGVSQEESLADDLNEEFVELFEKADREEEGALTAEKSPLSAALKAIGVESTNLQEDPRGFALVTDDKVQYLAALNKLTTPEAMHTLATKGWVATKCGDQAMANEAPQYKIGFLEISTAEAGDKEKAEKVTAIIKQGREYMLAEPEHDDDLNPVDHEASGDTELGGKRDGVGKPTDGKQPEGKIKDSIDGYQLVANLLEADPKKLKQPASGGKVQHAFKKAKKK